MPDKARALLSHVQAVAEKKDEVVRAAREVRNLLAIVVRDRGGGDDVRAAWARLDVALFQLDDVAASLKGGDS